MDSRKLTILMLIFAGGLLAVTFYVRAQKAARQSDQSTSAQTQPSYEDGPPASTQTAQVAATRLTVQPASPAPEAKTRAETDPGNDDDTIKLYARSNPAQIVRIGSVDPRSGYTFQAELTSRGAAVRGLKLSEHFATVDDKRLYAADPAAYEQARLEDQGKYRGHYALLNPVGTDTNVQQLSMATGLLKVAIPGETRPVEPVDLAEMHWTPLPKPPVGDDPDSHIAAFEVTLHAGTTPQTARPLLRAHKTYRVNKNDYSVAVSLRFENLSKQPLELTVEQAGPTGVPREAFQGDMRRAAYGILQSDEDKVQPQGAADQKVQPRLKNIKDARDMAPGQKTVIGRSNEKDPVLWIGYVNKFFGSMMYLRPTLGDRLEAPAYQAEFYLESAADQTGSPTYLTGVRVPKMLVKPGKAWDIEFDVFAGPKRRDTFTNEKDKYFKPIYKALNYIGTIDFGGCPCAFNWLTLAMMWLLSFFSNTIAFGNYGVAIIILVLLVRLVLHPLTKKSQVSMMGMQKLAPQMQKLKEKYADDKNALNREMMKLYKEQGKTPLLGCLPMFLQMPIWIALFTGLRAAVELRHAAFLPVWITDLSAPDALFEFPWALPMIGETFNLLPLLLGVAMFFQQKFTPTTAQPGASSEQAQQTQKMMKYMFPFMLPVLFYKAPSGLTLYIMASTFAGVLDQYFVRRHIREKEAAEAAVQTTITVPGKVARSSRPKKPKGPFWVKKG